LVGKEKPQKSHEKKETRKRNSTFFSKDRSRVSPLKSGGEKDIAKKKKFKEGLRTRQEKECSRVISVEKEVQ